MEKGVNSGEKGLGHGNYRSKLSFETLPGIDDSNYRGI